MTVSRVLRPLAPALLAVAVVSVSGCSWFHKGQPRGDYKLSPQERPLEVPPDLNMPSTAGAMQVPSPEAGSAAPAQAPSSSAFTAAGTRDEVFTKLGTSLGGIDGVAITSKAQILGTYEVSYQGASFLVRVTDGQQGALVSAVDARGLAANGPEATRLMATLKNQLGGGH